MKLDEIRLDIKPRSYLECCDLALVVIRKHFFGLLITALIGITPFLALNVYLFQYVSTGLIYTIDVFMLVFLIFMEIPWATSLMTIYLGEATFAPKVSMLEVFAKFFRSFWDMVFIQTFFRAILTPLTLFLYVFFAWKYMNEIILLERPSPKDLRANRPNLYSWRHPFRSLYNFLTARNSKKKSDWTWARIRKRRTDFYRTSAADIPSNAIAEFLLGSVMLFLLNGIVQSVTDLWNQQWKWESRHLDSSMFLHQTFPIFSWEGQLAIWILIGFLAVVRFLTYLDCRIRSEGWDVNLKFRAQAERLFPAEHWETS